MTDPDEPEVRLLEERFPVSYAIFAMARVHRGLAATRLAELGLFPNQEIALVHLGAEDGVAQKDLARTLRVNPVTVAKMVGRMERAGWVRRRVSPDDRRVTLVDLTDAGRALEREIVALWAGLERDTVRLLDPEDRAAFVRIAGAVRTALDETAGATDTQPT